jgi:hypothetical protein
LALDIEYGTSGSGQIQTRVQAFLEMIEAKRRQPIEQLDAHYIRNHLRGR